MRAKHHFTDDEAILTTALGATPTVAFRDQVATGCEVESPVTGRNTTTVGGLWSKSVNKFFLTGGLTPKESQTRSHEELAPLAVSMSSEAAEDEGGSER